MSSSSFTNIPYDLLISCVEHPQLTVYSEKQLCKALLVWLSSSKSSLEFSSNFVNDYSDILKKVRIHLLPLGFATRLKRHFSQFASDIICALLDLLKNCSSSLLNAIRENNLDSFRIRITQYSEKVVLSGCAHITAAFLFLAVSPYDWDPSLKTRMIHAFSELDHFSGNQYQIIGRSLTTLSFEDVKEVDISKCPKLHFAGAIKLLQTAFPFLGILKATHCSNFIVEDLLYLINLCPLIHEVDLTIDVSPVILTKVSVLSASAERYQLSGRNPYKLVEEHFLSKFGKFDFGKSLISHMSKLTLEGRNEINDQELLIISSICDSLSYLNIKGCTLLTDEGISKLLCKCLNIHSLNLSYTSFGRISVMTLCSSHRTSSDGFLGVQQGGKFSYSSAFGLKQLLIDGCKDVDKNSIVQILSSTHMLENLSLRETALTDDALTGFMGSCLKSFDVSETMVSMEALAYVIRRNPDLRYLKATGCRRMHLHGCNNLSFSYPEGSIFEVLCKLGENCILNEVAFGWGFSSLSMERLEPAINKLRAITLSLGVSLSHHALYVLPKICPLLESMVLTFQVISDGILKSIIETLKRLKVLELRCCLGELTSFSNWINMTTLRTLKLNWVTPWMTNNDLSILTQNCLNLVEFSLSGCKLLDSDAQEVISSGWSGLKFLHLEDCGNVTSNGVSSLFNFKAMEDMLLRHTGRGIGRNFISDAASKLPLLRKLALDLCDACEHGFESPSHDKRFYLSCVRISCCKSQRCGFELLAMNTFKPVHKETIVLEWNHEELRTTLVRERI